MAEHQLPKLTVRVRFPSPAPYTETPPEQAERALTPSRRRRPLAYVVPVVQWSSGSTPPSAPGPGHRLRDPAAPHRHALTLSPRGVRSARRDVADPELG